MSPFFEGEDLGGQGRVAHLGSEETNQYSATRERLLASRRCEQRLYEENLNGEKGLRSYPELCPSITSAITRAVIGASRIPSRKCPVATK